MSFTLTLGPTGVYEKLGGPPLVPGQLVMLNEGFFNLPPSGPRVSTYRGCTVRAWVIPTFDGMLGLSEVLVPDGLLPTPPLKGPACTNP